MRLSFSTRSANNTTRHKECKGTPPATSCDVLQKLVLLVDLLIHKEVVSITAKSLQGKRNGPGGGEREFPRWWEPREK